MTIKSIDYERCNHCAICYNICPMDVFGKEDREAKGYIFVKYPNDCMSCYLCEMDCPEDAIYVSPERPEPAVLPW